MSDYPRMLYRKSEDAAEVFGLKCETTVADSGESERDLMTDGWARTPFEAHGVDAPKADPIDEEPPLDDEKLGLLDEIDQLRREVSDLRERIATAGRERDQAIKDAAEAQTLLSEATKPAEPPKKEKLGIKAD